MDIISRLPSGGADVSPTTATAPDVISPKVIVGTDGLPITGTYNASNLTEANVKSGVAFGAEKTGTFTSGGTLESGKMLEGQKGWSNGVEVNGNIQSISPDNLDTLIADSVVSGLWSGDGVDYTYLRKSSLNGKFNNGINYLRYPTSDALNTIGAKRYATGTVSAISGTVNASYQSGTETRYGDFNYVIISGLSFTPQMVRFVNRDGYFGGTSFSMKWNSNTYFFPLGAIVEVGLGYFKLPYPYEVGITWEAWG